jgi:hypothetical protein
MNKRPLRPHKKFPKKVTLVTLLETGELQMDIPNRVFAELGEQFNQAKLFCEDNCERNPAIQSSKAPLRGQL